MSAIVELRDLRKSYGKKDAVKGISLTVENGELFVLLGPNGAGKTTTLKMMSGLLKPTSGTMKQEVEAKRLLSFVPDTPYVYEKLSPVELLRFVGKLYEMKGTEIEKRSDELLEFFSLSKVRDVLIEEFSHGMRQKAVLSAALLHRPKVLILDEPMVGLDPVSIKSFKDFLKEQTRGGMTIIFSTHTLSMAEELADRIAVIDKGLIAAMGTLDELKKGAKPGDNLEAMFMKLVQKN